MFTTRQNAQKWAQNIFFKFRPLLQAIFNLILNLNKVEKGEKFPSRSSTLRIESLTSQNLETTIKLRLPWRQSPMHCINKLELAISWLMMKLIETDNNFHVLIMMTRELLVIRACLRVTSLHILFLFIFQLVIAILKWFKRATNKWALSQPTIASSTTSW